MVNRYILIKEYNPAYSYWLRAYLKKRRILGDREYSWKEAQGIIMDMDKRGVRDDFFEKYFSAWTDSPEHPPDYFNLLRMAISVDNDDGAPDLTVIAKLDSEARERGERILFTVEDAAKDFYEFYDKFLIKPLARDLERGANGNKLVRFFEYEEFTKVPNYRAQSPEMVEKATQELARELFEWLGRITSQKIADDVRRTLDEHYDKGLAEASPRDGYDYQSEYAHFSAHKSEGAVKPAKTFLTPARHYGVIKEGYEGVHYPTYHVLMNS